MFKRNLLSLAAIISLSTSSYFGSTFTTYEGELTLVDNCPYTQTTTGHSICYLDLIRTAANNKLGAQSGTFLTQLSSIIAQQDANPNWGMNPKDHEPFYNALMVIKRYSDTRSHRFQQPDPEKPYYEAKLLETDINFAVGLIQSMIYRAKERFTARLNS